MASDQLPKNAYPSVEIQFPAKTPGQPRLTRRYELKEGYGGKYSGPVRVPDEAGLGMATMTMSFDDWKEGAVIPATVEIPVVDFTAEEKAAHEKVKEAARQKDAFAGKWIIWTTRRRASLASEIGKQGSGLRFRHGLLRVAVKSTKAK